MYRVDRNNFYKTEKKATIYTPDKVSVFIYQITHTLISKKSYILDPCVGKGSLLLPWKKAGWEVKGIDIEKQGFEATIEENYLKIVKGRFAKPSLVLMNPPFNIDLKTKTYIKEHYGGRPLLPEIWLMKALELFGSKVPIIMFTPYGFRLNQTEQSKRWQKFINQEYPSIKSIISLPKNVFANVLFHSEILLFNIAGLKAHYFLNECEVK